MRALCTAALGAAFAMMIGGFNRFLPASYAPDIKVHVRVQNRSFGPFDHVFLEGEDLTRHLPQIHPRSPITWMPPLSHSLATALPAYSTLELGRTFIAAPSLHSWIKALSSRPQKSFDVHLLWQDVRKNWSIDDHASVLAHLKASSSLPLSWSLAMQDATGGFQEHIVLAIRSFERP